MKRTINLEYAGIAARRGCERLGGNCRFYYVTKVANALEPTPGDRLDEYAVKQLINSKDTVVNISKGKK